jgi:hypothetical protein
VKRFFKGVTKLWRAVWVRPHNTVAKGSATQNQPSCAVVTVTPRFCLGIHYFGAHDPISFWDGLRIEDVPKHFAQIRDDGFNTINLLIPWHAFFAVSGQGFVDAWYGQKLIALLKHASEYGLSVNGRIFYAYSPTVTSEAIEYRRQYALLSDKDAAIQKLEIDAEALCNFVRDCKAWRGAFITWEDFYACFEGPAYWLPEHRVTFGKTSGFSDWIQHSNLNEEARQRELQQVDSVWVVPEHGTRAMSLWLRFFDHVLRERILLPSSKYFGALSIEVRADAYPVPKEDNETEWLYFDNFSDWSGQKMLYWGPFFGAQNQGEKLTAKEAMRGFEYLLSRYEATGANNKPVVDQFNFTDETLLFANHNAKIKSDEISAFIVGTADVLRKSTGGYALWAYRDYRENWLVNPSFQRDDAGWVIDHNTSIAEHVKKLLLQPTAIVTQAFAPEMRAQAKQEVYQDFFCEIETEATSLAVLVNELLAESVAAPNGFLKFKTPNDKVNWKHSELKIVNTGDLVVSIKCVYFYGFVQRLHVRNEYGEPSQYLSAIHTLNSELADKNDVH